MGKKEKEEGIKGIKLKNGILVRERGRKSTPSPTWRFGVEPQLEDNSCCCSHLVQDFNFPITNTLSARKIGANFWESQPQVKIMNKGGGRARLRHQQQRNHRKYMGFDQLADNPFDERPGSPPQLQESPSSWRKHVTASLIQHHPSVERNRKNLQHVSPASYSSSIEVAPHNGAVTPASSLDFSGRIGEASYGLKSSTELLKILNRIWSLEEQQASNLSLIKALTRERDLSRARMKDLVQGRKRDQQEIEKLRKQSYSVQSVRDELEDERKLRKHSESLHRKLARELSEVKSSILNAVKELEREKSARVLLENLCDEFAKGIRDYEQELRLSKQKPEKDLVKKVHHPDRLILHVSEAWLDERTQMKQAEAGCDFPERSTIVDKLSYEIKMFLQAKQKSSVGPEYNEDVSSKKLKENRSRRHSLESFHLNEAGSAPKNGIYGEDSNDIGTCFELNHGSSGKQKFGGSKLNGENSQTLVKSNSMKKQVHLREAREENSVEVKDSQLEKSEITQEEMQDSKNNRVGEQAHESNSNNVGDDFVSSALEGIEDSIDRSATAGHDTTVREWMSRTAATDLGVSESSSKCPRGTKENTLKAKLLEARLENKQFRSRTVKGSF